MGLEDCNIELTKECNQASTLKIYDIFTDHLNQNKNLLIQQTNPVEHVKFMSRPATLDVLEKGGADHIFIEYPNGLNNIAQKFMAGEISSGQLENILRTQYGDFYTRGTTGLSEDEQSQMHEHTVDLMESARERDIQVHFAAFPERRSLQAEMRQYSQTVQRAQMNAAQDFIKEHDDIDSLGELGAKMQDDPAFADRYRAYTIGHIHDNSPVAFRELEQVYADRIEAEAGQRSAFIKNVAGDNKFVTLFSPGNNGAATHNDLDERLGPRSTTILLDHNPYYESGPGRLDQDKPDFTYNGSLSTPSGSSDPAPAQNNQNTPGSLDL